MLKGLEKPQPFNVKVIENGREVMRPDVVNAVVNLGMLGQLSRIRKALERENFQGKPDYLELSATDEDQYVDLLERGPNTPWAKATILNRGPDTAYFSINKARPFTPLYVGEPYIIDFIKADQRIEYIEYHCDSGETATLDARGKY
jgi:hypothetical protein